MNSGPKNAIGDLWQCLRNSQCEELAPKLLALGIRSPNDLIVHTSDLLANGVTKSQLESMLQAAAPAPARPVQSGRATAPVPVQAPHRASFQAAAEAGHPNNRKRSLEALDEDVLSKTTHPALQSRLRTVHALCAIWEVPTFPLTPYTIRCLGASFKKGGYRSCQLYFQAAVQHQVRHLCQAVDPLVHQVIRDVTRSIRRGLGPSKLKDSFDPLVLHNISCRFSDEPFDFESPSHFRDVMVLSIWFMLRELELAASMMHHLTINEGMVSILIPLHKTDTDGSSCYRSLQCACQIQSQPLCPLHAAERHLVRLLRLQEHLGKQTIPLCPTPAGTVPTKNMVIQQARQTLVAAGVEVERQDAFGVSQQRFGGHCMRVSGAQFLARAGVPIPSIQLLGRWTSTAIERYTQQAGLVTTQGIPTTVLSGVSTCSMPATQMLQIGAAPATPAVQRVASQRDSRDLKELREAHETLSNLVATLDHDVAALRTAVMHTDTSLIVRCTSQVVHRSQVDEVSNNPSEWRTRCGWQYGSARFFRVADVSGDLRRCRKCFSQFDDEVSGSASGGEHLDEGSGASSSASVSDVED